MLYGLEPGWLGASFGLRNCYVRIVITRYACTLFLLLTLLFIPLGIFVLSAAISHDISPGEIISFAR